MSFGDRRFSRRFRGGEAEENRRVWGSCQAGRSSIQASCRSIGKGLMTSVPTLPFVMCFATSVECAGAGVLLGRPIVDPSLLPLYRDGGLMTSVPTSPFVTGFVMAAV